MADASVLARACASYVAGARAAMSAVDRLEIEREGGWACILMARLILRFHADNPAFPVEQTVRLIEERDQRLERVGEPSPEFVARWVNITARVCRPEMVPTMRALWPEEMAA